MRTAIINANIVTASEVITNGSCVLSNGKIIFVGKELPEHDCTIDAEGKYLIPGFIDLHCHGGGGLEFMDASADEMERIAHFHLRHACGK